LLYVYSLHPSTGMGEYAGSLGEVEPTLQNNCYRYLVQFALAQKARPNFSCISGFML